MLNFLKQHWLSVLVALVPFLSVVSGVIESNTPIYEYIFSLSNINEGISRRLQNVGCVFDGDSHQHNIRPGDPEFENLWKIISKYSAEELPKTPVQGIYRFALKNGSTVSVPDNKGSNKECFLVPDSMPIAVAFCSSINDCNTQEVKIIGSISDLRSWENSARETLKRWIDFFIIIMGFLLAMALEMSDKPTNHKKPVLLTQKSIRDNYLMHGTFFEDGRRLSVSFFATATAILLIYFSWSDTPNFFYLTRLLWCFGWGIAGFAIIAFVASLMRHPKDDDWGHAHFFGVYCMKHLFNIGFVSTIIFLFVTAFDLKYNLSIFRIVSLPLAAFGGFMSEFVTDIVIKKAAEM